MKFYLNRKILMGFIVSIAIFISLGIGSFMYIQEVIRMSRLGLHAQQTILLAEQVKSCVSDTEGKTIRFLLSQDKGNAESLSESITLVRHTLGQLDSLVNDDADQKQIVGQLRDILENRIKVIGIAEINKSTNTNTAPALSFVYEGVPIIKKANNLLDEIRNKENRIRKAQQTNVTSQFYRFAVTFFGLVAAGLIVSLVMAYALNLNLKRRSIAEDKLKKASEAIHDLYENAPCGYFSIDKRGIFTNVNETFLKWLGYKREQVVDKLHFTDVLTGEAAKEYDRDFAQLKEQGFILDVESSVVCKDKSVVRVLINATAIVDKNDGFLSSRCTIFDITDRKKAEQEAKRLNAELESFSYSVSHDLRAPLRSINGFARILKEDYEKIIDIEGTRILGKIISNANRMGQLIDDLLDFSRAGKKDIKRAQINTNELVSTITDELIDQENGRSINVDIGELEDCMADPSMIRQVWINLISNAIKYSRKKEMARIEIGSYKKHENVIFYVKDNGVGFDMEFVDKLFGVFQRLHKMEDFEGTGVGLALVKRIVERHNGHIWAEAKLDEGAAFYFAMPGA